MRAFGLRYRTSVCIPYGKRTKINYKASLAQYIVLVKCCNLHIAFRLFLRICLSIKTGNLQNSTRSVPIYKAYRHGVWFYCLSVRLLYLDSPYKPFPLELYRRCGQCASARPQLNCRIAAAWKYAAEKPGAGNGLWKSPDTSRWILMTSLFLLKTFPYKQ